MVQVVPGTLSLGDEKSHKRTASQKGVSVGRPIGLKVDGLWRLGTGDLLAERLSLIALLEPHLTSTPGLLSEREYGEGAWLPERAYIPHVKAPAQGEHEFLIPEPWWGRCCRLLTPSAMLCCIEV